MLQLRLVGAQVRCELKHPAVRATATVNIRVARRMGKDGIQVPCLRALMLHTDLVALMDAPEPRRLFWNILDGPPDVFGVYEDRANPWFVMGVDDDLRRFAAVCSREVFLWLLELESPMVKVVWIFDLHGRRVPIERGDRFMEDFLQSYLEEEEEDNENHQAVV